MCDPPDLQVRDAGYAVRAENLAYVRTDNRTARHEWFEPEATPSIEDLHGERFCGIRPAFGYPACPDHSLKHELFDLLGAADFGLALTESFAMTPAASVSGLLFAHPAARYFTVGRIGKGQATDYASRRALPLPEVEHWLRPNLAYGTVYPAPHLRPRRTRDRRDLNTAGLVGVEGPRIRKTVHRAPSRSCGVPVLRHGG